MKKWTTVAAMLCLVVGCVGRVPLYSPRLPPSDGHRSATSNAACLECHDVTSQASHKPIDDCRNCHKLCKEC